MWRTFATLILGLAHCGSALAGEDAIASPSLDWSGAYLGAIASYTAGSATGIAGCCIESFDIEGTQAGGLAGYNFAFKNAIAGIEVDALLLDANGTGFSGAIDDFAAAPVIHLRGRIGLPTDKILLYMAAGLSLGEGTSRISGIGSAAEWHLGWNAGAGVEVAMSRHVAIRAEYVYDSMFWETYRYSQGDLDLKWASGSLRVAALYKF